MTKKMQVTPQEHKERVDYAQKCAKEIKGSDPAPFLTKTVIPLKRAFKLFNNGDEVSKTPFGAYGTLATSGCMAFATHAVLATYGNYTIEEVVADIVNNGYRITKFEGFPKTFGIAKYNLEQVKMALPNDPFIQGAKSLDEIEEKYGPLIGVGGSAFYFDALAEELNLGKVRATSWEQVVEHLQKGKPVVARVSNKIYFPDKEGGHYLVIDSLIGDSVVCYDNTSNTGYSSFERKKFVDCCLADPNLIGVWLF